MHIIRRRKKGAKYSLWWWICFENRNCRELQEWKGYPIFRDRGEYLEYDDRIVNWKLVKLCRQTILVRSITKKLKIVETMEIYISLHTCAEVATFSCRWMLVKVLSYAGSWLIVGSVPVFPEDVRDVTY